MSNKIEKVGNLCEQIRGLSYNKNDASNSPRLGSVPVLRANNISNNGKINFDDIIYVPQNIIKPKQLLRKGDILIAASSGSINVVGKAARLENNIEGSFGAFCKVLRPKEIVDSLFFSFFFQSNKYRQTVSRLANGANINNLKNEHFDDLEIPLPLLDEQKRIAAILDKADQLRNTRRKAIAECDEFLKSTFIEMFGDPVTNPKGWDDHKLDKISEIKSGVTKGRKLNGKISLVPYMRVANVQDGHICLDEIKTIEATPDDVEKYALQNNDILLTEGGDPDKLGRGAVWHNEISPCIHQNHIFRVRPHVDLVNPDYLSTLIGSQRGKRYFLKSSKQTTGIASINMTQLKSFPALVPPLPQQEKFAEIVKQTEAMKERMKASERELDDNFNSLMQRAFKGEL